MDGDERTVLLSGARAVLARDGLDALRVDDVLAAAGLSTRAFYRHFKSKTELFLALFSEESARAAERLRARVAAAPDPEAKVRTWIDGVLALAYDRRVARATRVFSRERALLALEFPEDVDACVRAQVASLEAAIADGRDAGDFPGADPATDARAIHHLCAGLLNDRLWAVADPLSRPAATNLALRFALGALRS